MNTGLDFKKMMSISGSAPEDQLAAEEFARTASALSERKLRLIEDVLHARTELSAHSLREAKDAQSTIAQLVATVREIDKTHATDALSPVFEALKARLLFDESHGRKALLAIQAMYVQ
jgi:DTW domain-containing protein YfiP